MIRRLRCERSCAHKIARRDYSGLKKQAIRYLINNRKFSRYFGAGTQDIALDRTSPRSVSITLQAARAVSTRFTQ